MIHIDKKVGVMAASNSSSNFAEGFRKAFLDKVIFDLRLGESGMNVFLKLPC
jgi:hypothetical protein